MRISNLLRHRFAIFGALLCLLIHGQLLAGGRHGHSPIGDGLPDECPPTPATDGGGGPCCTGSGDPIKVVGGFNGGGDHDYDGLSFSTTFEDMHDFSVPVKHGLSLDVHRIYTGDVFTRRNHKGFGPLGYHDPSGEKKCNWFLSPYDCEITRRPHFSNTDLDDRQLVFVNEVGNWVYFSQIGGGGDPWFLADASDQLYKPVDDRWTTVTWATKYIPELPTTLGRQTTHDMTLYILHAEEPSSRNDAINDEANILGFVLRYASGGQYHFERAETGWSGLNETFAEGRLRYMDANWRNNVAFGDTGHVDDYLEITYINSHCKGTTPPTAGIKTIERVKAPPSDGRSLVFNHPVYTTPDPDSIFTHVTSIDLDTSGTLYEDLVQYSYIDTGSDVQIGKIKDAIIGRGNGDNPVHGTRYTYGLVTGISGSTFSFDEDPDDHRANALVRISRFAGGGETPFVTTEQRYSVIATPPDQDSRYTTQYIIDPTDGTTWRKAFTITNLGSATTPKRLTWMDGQILGEDEHTRYTDSSPLSHTDYNLNGWGSYTHMTYGNVSNPPPDIRQIYYTGPVYTSLTRLLNLKYLFVPEDEETSESMITLVDYDYLDDDSSSANETGNKYPVRITQYAGFELDGTELVADEDQKLVTEFAYDDADFPAAASQVDYPGGERVLSDYNTLGDVLQVVRQQYNSDTLAYDTLSTTTLTYVDNGSLINDAVNTGLVEQKVVEIAGGPTHITTNVYTDPDGNGIGAGRIAVVTVDDKATTFTWNDFGDVKTVTTEFGTETTTYSDELTTTDPEFFLPPRVIGHEDRAGDIAAWLYDAVDRLTTTTLAPGEAEEQTTVYAYDYLDHVSSVTAPDGGVTSYEYNIYGKVIAMTDPEGTTTHYVRDAFGRVVTETVEMEDETAYNIDYTYVDSSSICSSCGGGGGGEFQVAMRTITNADRTTTETLDFTYDLLGRLIAHHDSVSDRTITYTHDFDDDHGSRLVEIDHGESYIGTNKLRYEYDEHNRLKRDIGYFGRSTDFEYDLSGRLTSLKDPFGFITNLAYDDGNKGRLDEVAHSTLGVAAFDYNDDDTLAGYSNGAVPPAGTEYTYDEFGRLVAFEHIHGENERIAHHSWDYDVLGRKMDIALDLPELPDLEAIELTYDAASRLASEVLTTSGADEWNVAYAYDQAGNRTSYDPGTESEIAYGVGNREIDVSTGDALEYDFKGNVTVRPPLAGGDSVIYTWDAHDRMIEAYNGAQNAYGAYFYDGLGRLSARVALDLDYSPWAERVDLNHWLGLNKLCEERYFNGYEPEVLRPDDEVEEDPADNGWYVVADMGEYVNDADRSNVIHLAGDDFFGSGLAIIGDLDTSDENPNDVPFDYQDGRVTMWFKNNNTTDSAIFNFFCRNTNDDPQTLIFYTEAGDDSGEPDAEYMSFYLGGGLNDGEWHYLEFDLNARVEQFGTPEYYFGRVDSLAMTGLDMDVNLDDMVIGSGLLGKSYQLIPGVPIGGIIGTQIGAAGSHTDDFYTTAAMPGWSKFYYNYNDLGTVTSTVDDAGTIIGVYEPDFFGNYRYVDGVRPDNLGLQSTGDDSIANASNVWKRWRDNERGRWLSREPFGFDGPNLYHFVFNQPTRYIDATGLFGGPWPVDPDTGRPYGDNGDRGEGIVRCGSALFNLGVGMDPTVGNPYKHCVWNCRMQRECDSWVAPVASFVKEVADVFGAGFGHQGMAESAFQPSDQVDNMTGRSLGTFGCPQKTCEQLCKEAGIGPNTREGPGTERPYGPFYRPGMDIKRFLESGRGFE